ncbi:MAG: hypothetical protein AB7G21_13895 [Dehalococcoidia bacterium]
MKISKRWIVGGLGLAAAIGSAVAAVRLRARRALSAVPFLAPETRVALRDAGWVQLQATDAMTPRGRGQLFVWTEVARPGRTPRILGRIDSFTAAGTLPLPGEDVVVLVEQASERSPARVTRVEALAERTAVSLEWADGSLPVTLRELGGH